MFLFKQTSEMLIKNPVSDCFGGLKIMALKSPNNFLV